MKTTVSDAKYLWNFWLNPFHSLFCITQYWQRIRYHEYFNGIEKKPLTKEQRQAVILDESRNLIIAGAGTGKTSTIIGKVGYLLKRRKCSPDEILVIAYNKAAAAQLKERIAQMVGAEVQVGTFHSIGRQIIRRAELAAKPSPFVDQKEKLTAFISALVEECLKEGEMQSNLMTTTTEYKAEECLKEGEMQSLYMTFFSRYELPEKDEHKDFKTLGEYSNWVRTNYLRTLNGENVKSFGELLIANFLFIYGVEYEYEEEYFTANNIKARDFYHPDFRILLGNSYIEYFGIDENRQTAPYIPREKYLQEMRWKEHIHRKNGTDLISLYYHQNRDGLLWKCLKEELLKRNVSLEVKSPQEILAQINKTAKHKQFAELLIRFLTQFKENNNSITLRDLSTRAHGDKRSTLFLRIFAIIHRKYQARLQERGEIDFGDMISTAARLVLQKRYAGAWRYIIIDEFQDISAGRAELIKALLRQSRKTKLFCVGDDWQAIYGFAGADHLIMNEFERMFGRATALQLRKTFRFNDKIAETSGKFVTKNPSQIKKELSTLIEKEEPQIVLHWTDATPFDATRETVQLIKEEHETDNKSLRLLCRYNRSKLSLQQQKEIASLWGGQVLSHSTIHSTKGLEADFIILTDLNAEMGGFPSERENDPILKLVLAQTDPFPHSEERRLFYVALTRAREQAHLVANSILPSSFALELESKEYVVRVIGEKSAKKECPECEGGVIVEKKLDTGSIFSCSNYPLCDYKAAKCYVCNSNRIERSEAEDGRHLAACVNEGCREEYTVCGKCEDGILVQKQGPRGPFLGCHTYHRTKCSGTKKLSPGEGVMP